MLLAVLLWCPLRVWIGLSRGLKIFLASEDRRFGRLSEFHDCLILDQLEDVAVDNLSAAAVDHTRDQPRW